MVAPNWKDRPTQMELNRFVDGDKLVITWSGGNKGEWIVIEKNGINYVYPAHLEKYKDFEHREQMINYSLTHLNDVDVWAIEEIK